MRCMSRHTTPRKRMSSTTGCGITLRRLLGVPAVAHAAVFLACVNPGGPGEKQPVPGSGVTVLSPNGGEQFGMGDTIRIRWEADTNKVDDVLIRLLVDGGEDEIVLTTTESIYTSHEQWGDFTRVVPDDAIYDKVSLVTDRASILVHHYRYASEYRDYSDGYFSIGGPRGEK